MSVDRVDQGGLGVFVMLGDDSGAGEEARDTGKSFVRIASDGRPEDDEEEEKRERREIDRSGAPLRMGQGEVDL